MFAKHSYKLIFILFGLFLFFSSCTTSRKCYRKFPPQVQTIVKDSIVVKLDTIYVHEQVTLYDTIVKEVKTQQKPLKDVLKGIIKTDTSILENEFSIGKAWVDNKLFHILEQKEQIRPITGEWATKIAHHYKEYYRTTQITEVHKVPYYPKWLIILACIGGASIIFIGVWLFFKIKAGWLNGIARNLR